MTEPIAAIPFEFEFQRAMPIAMFYLWYRGHVIACRKLDLDESLAKKVFAVNDRGVFRVYSQVDNIEKMKAAALQVDEDKLASVIEHFTANFGAFALQNERILEAAFAEKLAGEFVLTFVIGDLKGHPLQEKALKARVGSENMFYMINDVLAYRSGAGPDYPLYSFDELLAGIRFEREVLAARQHSLLTADAIAPFNDEAAALASHLAAQGLTLYERPPQPTLTELKGQTAFPGLVVGTAKIVLRASEVSKLEAGDVIISSMTSPEFLPLMKVAAALVTDEGGITSHAAIIARELGCPCLVGTRLATKVFKDGDRLEVDATHGLVRLIK